MYSNLPKNYLYSAYKVDIVFTDGSARKEAVGTAFVIGCGNNNFSIVTNRHVLDIKYQDYKYKDFWIETIIFSGRRDDDSLYKFSIELDTIIAISEFNKEDVALLINPVIRSFENMKSQQLFYHFHINDLANENDFPDISPFDLLAISGYFKHHDSLSERPLLRAGRIASDPKSNYPINKNDAGRCVAYEGFSYDGGSGSPVFALARGVAGMPDCRRGYLVGINAGHIIEGHNDHSGISYFFKSTIILEILAANGFNQTR